MTSLTGERERMALRQNGRKVGQCNIKDERSPAKLLVDRTPSTSPPPASPTEEYAHSSGNCSPPLIIYRLMREGFDQDDVYIMVEDEFYAIAQSFTQHLHYAEYMRMKKAAKNAAPAAIRSIARPIDSKTVMREELKRKKQSEALAAKQQAGLKQSVAGKLDPATDEDENAEDDPWVGTSLQGLMATPRKSQQALVGLDRIKSSTRAAAGYAMAETPSSRRSAGFNKLLDITPLKGRSERDVATESSNLSSDEAENLDSPPVIQERSIGKTAEKATTSSHTSKSTAASSTSRKESHLPVKSRLKMMDDFDELFELSQQNKGEDDTSKLTSPQKSQRPPNNGRGKARRTDLDDIPLFMG